MKTLLGRILTTVVFACAVAVTAGIMAGCDGTDKYLRTTPAFVDVASDELTAPITVESSSSWMAEALPDSVDWFAENNYYNYSGEVLWINLGSANETLVARTTAITIVSGDGLTVTVPVTQRALDARFEVTPMALEPFDGQGSQTRTLTVNTNVGLWNFSTEEDWLTITRGEAGEANILTLGAEPSRSLEARRDMVVVRPDSPELASLADSVAVEQRGLNLVAISEEYMNGETYAIELPAEGGEVVIQVLAREPWTVEADDPESRATLGETDGEADTEYGVPLVVTVAENTTAESYTFTLNFTCGGEQYGYEVIQAAGTDAGTDE